MKQLFLLLILFFAIHSSAISRVRINAWIPGAKSEVVRIYSSPEIVSNNKECIAFTRVDAEGWFHVDIECYFPSRIIIDIASCQQSILIEPDKTYDLRSEQFVIIEGENPAFSGRSLGFQLSNVDINAIGKKSDKLDSLYSDFLQKEFVRVFRQRDTKAVQIFADTLQNIFRSDSSTYIQQKVKFLTAGLLYQTNQLKREELQSRYLSDRPIYQNDEFVVFFETLMQNYFSSQKFVNYSNIQEALFTKNPVEAALDTLGSDPLLKHEMQRELALMFIIRDLYYQSASMQSKLLQVITDFKNYTTFKKHKIILEYLAIQLKYLKPGTELPSVIPYLAEGRVIDLVKESKPLYLVFARTTCISCMDGLDLLALMPNDILRNINVAVVILDRDALSAQQQIQSKAFPFSFYYTGIDPAFTEIFRIKGLPNELLIGSDRLIIANPAMRPGDDLEYLFYQMVKKSK
ncbi:MAG: hypothetical protein Q7J34_12725 [Bacteroidales bacterium]|jgi:hypothetical protein|nr:hypothetical protein [Bacteroidales bacterium]